MAAGVFELDELGFVCCGVVGETLWRSRFARRHCYAPSTLNDWLRQDCSLQTAIPSQVLHTRKCAPEVLSKVCGQSSSGLSCSRLQKDMDTDTNKCECRYRYVVDSNKLEHGCRIILAGFPSLFALGLKDGRVPTFRLLLYSISLLQTVSLSQALKLTKGNSYS